MTDVSPRALAKSARGLTLMELLVVVSIVALLLSILLPTVSAVRSQAKNVRCMVNLRNIAFEFRLFADDGNHADRERK